MWEIEFFELPGGRCPVKDFLLKLNKKTDLPYINKKLSLLKELGYELRRPHAAYLREKIYELRISTENGQYRILYFFFDKNKIVITNGFMKKTGPVPKNHIDLAIKYRKMYFEGSVK